jgi:hypothetical protein
MQIDRRHAERINVVRPAKIHNCRSDRYIAAETCNLSRGGALMKVDRAHPVADGDRIEIAVDWSRSPGLISSTDMVAGRIVRVSSIDYLSQSVAVEFDQVVAENTMVNAA